MFHLPFEDEDGAPRSMVFWEEAVGVSWNGKGGCLNLEDRVEILET